VDYSDFCPSVSFLFSNLIRTGINEIQTVLATVSQSSAVKRNGNLPIAKTAVRDVARRERR
jgi:hypothetical protein